ncbi:MAG: transposase [Candidatus Portnoybacteria bacterium]|nr:transposase [Candidatus Portnoybacteria bacterium]
MKKEVYPQDLNERKLPIKVTRKQFNKHIDRYLSRGRRGPKPKLSRCKIFNYILYVLHTGIQWDQLQTKRNELHWSNIYKWHLKWSKDDSYKNLFETGIQELFLAHKLDLSILHGDGSNTVAKKGASA